MSKPLISKLFIYPIKSLDPIALQKAEVGFHSLKNDRIFAMKTPDGRYVNGKRTGRVNQLEAKYDLEKSTVSLGERGTNHTETFELRIENEKLNQFLSDFFELDIELVHSSKGELLDVPHRSSATIISTTTYQSLLQNFAENTLEDFRLRFRTNIEIENAEAYWEEQLIEAPGKAVRFTIGEVNMIGMTPRARCNVPPRNPITGETNKAFIKKMMAHREESLPSFSNLSAFGNMYHLSVDCYIPPTEAGKIIKQGDEINIADRIDLSELRQ